MTRLALFALVSAAWAGNKYYTLDTFESGDSATYQGGFGEYECAGVVFEPDEDDYPLTPLYVDVLFGPDSIQETVVIQIYAPMTTDPPMGTRVGEEAFAPTGSRESFNRLVFEDAEIYLDPWEDGNVLVALCFEENHYEYPTIAADSDGLDFISNHYIYANFGAGADWYTTQYVNGVLGGSIGDWIMRLCVETDNDDGEPCPNGTDVGDADTDADADTDTDSDADGDSDTDGDFYITSITPNSAPQGESVQVVILGGGFGDGTDARIGGINLTGMTIQDDGTIVGQVPTALQSGFHDVEVVSIDGENDYLTSGFEVTGGCGCASTPTTGALATGLLALIGFVGLRRRD